MSSYDEDMAAIYLKNNIRSGMLGVDEIEKLISDKKEKITLISKVYPQKDGNDPIEFYQLEKKQQIEAVAWVLETFRPIKNINASNTSYGYKHMFEWFHNGFYMNNGEMKGAFLIAGFNCNNPYEINWCFNVSKSDVKRLSELKNRTWEYR
ncbi:hypothetical protein [Ligilactobacillus acidipiscis]|uniref:hypothetical protein n=1 Tax=Ligilactobacillus acidipiscis TaxID=89059 RepID=UPI0023F63552|nr:hypothetical protein [Ligilactobacillus acidipiscis]WEV56688.1 hypothetical protein OZX66_10755 [Ligilactobacillus acidipiscis]